MEDKKFTLIVEGNSADVGHVAPHKLELNGLIWNGESPPDIVIMPAGAIMLVKVGRYAAPGDQYCYRIATVAKLIGGQLEPDKDNT